MRRLEAFLYIAAQNFRLFFKILKSKFKNLKHIVVNLLSWAFPMVDLIWSEVPLKVVGNEKEGGSERWQMIDIGLGQW